ncbi:Nucleotidase [Lactobacillus kimbladii]|uniref:Nucleotidase n=1 Tax=Lactobacillus kimbladii TaxID=1218506 RepID=A0A0F4LI45_9LACO|nr:bifunctional UDP-sugar hydrolase/5'-nucleotidase [Lactobacillus kimbladii]KJY58270.1 Nucleotidase [Lactobacillus kimbladii]
MKLVFLHSSDIHGFIFPTDYQKQNAYSAPFGLTRLCSIIKQQRDKYGAENVIVTDSGDCLQGSPLAAYVHESNNDANLKAFAAYYKQINYDARCLGNHDFNFGLSYLKKYLTYSKAPFLNSNILAKKNDLPAFGQNYIIINKNGIKVGIIGITTQRVPFWEPAEHVAGLKFISAFEQVKQITAFLRPKVDVLAVLYHGGFEADPRTGTRKEPHTGENEGYRILHEIPGIDVMLTGHQHRRLSLVERKTAIVQPGYRGEAIGKIVLDFDQQKKKIITMSTELIDARDYEPDGKINDSSLSLEQQAQKWLDQPIAYLDEPALILNANEARIKGSPFINLLQDMQLYFTKADISATALMSETAQGFNKKVSMRDILLNYPFANQLCIVKVTGKELRNIVEYSLKFLTKENGGNIIFDPAYRNQLFNFDLFYPLNYEADIARPLGDRLIKLELNGHPILARKTYRLAVNNYRAMGGGFYPEYNVNKIEKTLDKDYVEMFKEFLTIGHPKVNFSRNYRFS